MPHTSIKKDQPIKGNAAMRPVVVNSRQKDTVAQAQYKKPGAAFNYNYGKMQLHSPLPAIQAKLSVNISGDKYEKEADAKANQISKGEKRNEQPGRSPNGITQIVQTKGDVAATTASPHLENNIAASRGSGSSMDDSTQSFMAGSFGIDFSKVKIHTDDKARQMNEEINARAFTVGEDVYFNKGEYQPGSPNGTRLLAHELTHVAQQSGGGQRIQKDDPAPDAATAAEAKKKTGLITKIKTYGVSAVEDGDATFTSAELDLVDKALSGLPATDKAAIKGAKIIRVSSLGPKTAGRYSNKQGYSGTTATDEQKIELSDRAFGATSAAESIRLITHEVGHGVAAMPYRVAMSGEVAAGVKSNKLVEEANVAVGKFNTANDETNTAIEASNAAVEVYNQAITGTDKAAITAAKKDLTAKKAEVARLKAISTAKETAFNTKNTAVETQKKVVATKEAATKTKIANIDDLKTDAAGKLSAMQTSYTAAEPAIKKDDAESSDYRTSLTTAENAIKTFYDENVTADVDEKTAESAKSVVDSVILDRNKKRDALNKLNPANTFTSATTALETAQETCFKSATQVALNKSMNLSVKRFYDFVIKNGISPALTPYAAENWPHKPEEFYAEAYSFFVTKPKDLEAFSKDLYEWFKAGSYK
ncbi:MAG: DUF4157 domain-containing protein [Ferruginibacter sp.]